MDKKALADLVGYKSFMSTPVARALMQTYATMKAQPDEKIVLLWGGGPSRGQWHFLEPHDLNGSGLVSSQRRKHATGAE